MVSRHSPGVRQVTEEERRGAPVQLVGRRVRRLRKERRLSLEQVAAAVGMQQADLLRLEKGEYRASLDVLFRILAVLEVSGEAFFAAAAQEERAAACSSEIRP